MADGSRIQAGRPVVLGPETDHYWLVQRMARTTGVDLVQAMDAGVLDPSGWSRIVTRCRACQWAEGCSHWLDASARQDAAADLPTPCLNRATLAKIRDTLEEN